MSFLANLKLGRKISGAFAVVALLLAGTVAVSLAELHRVEGGVTTLAEDDMVRIRYVANIESAIQDIGISMRNAAFNTDPPQVLAEYKVLEGLRAKAELNVKSMTEASREPEMKEALAAMGKARATHTATIDEILAMRKQDRRIEAGALVFSKLHGDERALLRATGAVTALQAAFAKQSVVAAHASVRRATLEMAAIGAVSLVLLIGIGIAITRSITGPIHRAVKIAETVAAGDLSSQIDATGTDETGQLLRALAVMNSSLVTLVGTVKGSADNIATGSVEIASGNADLSQRTEQQAASLEETSSSLEQLSSTVRSNAHTASSAAELAGAASAVAQRGGEVVGQVVATMTQINTSSKKITDIIGVIDGIAFQTNILALNAAVEAARAGEQGRGFAVVASEVRSLAQRSADAAREIKQLIGASVEQVESGTRLVDAAGATMADIVAQVQKVASMMAEIGRATEEQTSGIGQVTQAVAQLDMATQQNATLVQQSTAAVGSLNQQANRLVDAVRAFKV